MIGHGLSDFGHQMLWEDGKSSVIATGFNMRLYFFFDSLEIGTLPVSTFFNLISQPIDAVGNEFTLIVAGLQL